MQVEALWIVAADTLQEGIAVLGRAKTGLHLFACKHHTSDNHLLPSRIVTAY